MIIQYTITIQKRRDFWPFRSTKQNVSQLVRERLPKPVADKVRELPQDFSERQYYAGQVLTHYRSTYHGADIWWIQGYPEDEGSFIVVVEPEPDGDRIPSRIEELTVQLYGEIEKRIPLGLRINTNRVEYKRVAQVFSVVQAKVSLWVPETIAFIVVAACLGAWLSFIRFKPQTEANQVLYGYVMNILIGVLGSAISAFLVALCAWLVRRKNAKRGRRVVYHDK